MGLTPTMAVSDDAIFFLLPVKRDSGISSGDRRAMMLITLLAVVSSLSSDSWNTSCSGRS